MEATRLLIVIVNYRTADLVIDCLRSLNKQRAEWSEFRVTVVDNASADGSVDRIAHAIQSDGWRGWACILPLGINGGFAAGNNSAIREALNAPDPPQYIMLLNPDTIVLPGALRMLTDFLDRRQDVGIAGSGIEDVHGIQECTAHRLHSPLSELDRGARLGVLSRVLHRHVVSPPPPTEPQECQWVSGASMVIRREVFANTGLLDERYFLYFEEVDFCRRARRAGWRIWAVPAARVMHLEGQASGVADHGKRRGKYWFESRRRYFVTAYGIGGLVLADLLWAVGRVSFAMRQLCQVKQNTDPKCFAWDLLWGDTTAILSGNVLREPSRIDPTHPR